MENESSSETWCIFIRIFPSYISNSPNIRFYKTTWYYGNGLIPKKTDCFKKIHLFKPPLRNMSLFPKNLLLNF